MGGNFWSGERRNKKFCFMGTEHSAANKVEVGGSGREGRKKENVFGRSEIAG